MTALAGFWDLDGRHDAAARCAAILAAQAHLGPDDLDRVRDLVDRIDSNPLAASIIDTKVLTGLIGAWPRSGWERQLTIARYRNLFLQTLSAGAFLLFAQQPPPPPPPWPLERAA